MGGGNRLGSRVDTRGKIKRSEWQVNVVLGTGMCGTASIDVVLVLTDRAAFKMNVGGGGEKKCSLIDNEAVMGDWPSMWSRI